MNNIIVKISVTDMEEIYRNGLTHMVMSIVLDKYPKNTHTWEYKYWSSLTPEFNHEHNYVQYSFVIS